MIGRMAIFIVTVAAAMIVVVFTVSILTRSHEDQPWALGLMHNLGLTPISTG